MSSKTGTGKSLRGMRNASLDADALSELLSSPNFSLVGVDIQSSMYWSGTIDDTAIGSMIPGTGTFKDLTVGADGDGYPVSIYGNEPGKGLFWDPASAILNVYGSIRSALPSIFGNIRIAGNTISAINDDGGIHLAPQNSNGVVSIGGSIRQSSSGDVDFSNASSAKLVANGSGNQLLLRSTDASVDIGAGKDVRLSATESIRLSAAESIQLLATQTVRLSPGVPMVFGEGCTATLVGSTDGFIMKDPIPTLTSICGDLFSDCGISFAWKEGGARKVAFLGFIDDTRTFKFVPDAVISVLPNGTKKVTGLPGGFSLGAITGDPDIIFNAPDGRIILNTKNIQVGEAGSIKVTPDGGLNVESTRDLTFDSGTGRVIVSDSDQMYFGNDGTRHIGALPSGELFLNGGPKGVQMGGPGPLYFPPNYSLQFGDPDTSIVSDGLDLMLNARRNILPRPGVAMILPKDIPLQFGEHASTYIMHTSDGLKVNSSSSMTLTPAGDFSVAPQTGHATILASLLTLPATAEIAWGNSGGTFVSVSETGMNIAGTSDVRMNFPGKVVFESMSDISIPANTTLSIGDSKLYSDTLVDGALHISDAVGVVIDKNLTINGSLTVKGPYTEVTSTVTTFQDPILTLGGGTSPADLTDRGIDFVHWDGTEEKSTFMGWKRQLDRFVLVHQGHNQDEVYQIVDFADLQLKTLYAETSRVPTIFTESIFGQPDLHLGAQSIHLDASASVVLPPDVALRSGEGSLQYEADSRSWNIQASSVKVSEGSLSIGNATLVQTGNNGMRIGNVPDIFLDSAVTIPQKLFFGNAQQTGISLRDDGGLTIASPAGIQFDSLATFERGWTIGDSVMKWDQGRLALSNQMPSVPLDFSIKGSIYDAEWRGLPIAMSTGGTGHVGQWHAHCIPFVSVGSDFLDEHVDEFLYYRDTRTVFLRASDNRGILPREQQCLVLGSGNVELTSAASHLVFDNGQGISHAVGLEGDALCIKAAPDGASMTAVENLSVVFSVDRAGQVAIGFPDLQSLDAADRIDTDKIVLNGNLFFAERHDKMRWSSACSISGDEGLSLTSDTFIRLQSSVICAQELSFLNETGGISLEGSHLGDLHVRAPRDTWMHSPHVVITDRLCFRHDPITDYCLSHLLFDEALGNLQLVNLQGDIFINPKANLVLPDGKGIVIGSAGSISGNDAGLNINSPQGDIVLSPGGGDVKLPLNVNLDFGGISSLTQTEDALRLLGTTDLLLNVPKVVLPHGVPMVFNGVDGERKIVSLQDGLYVYGQPTIFKGDVTVLGNLTYTNSTSIGTPSFMQVDRNIITLGGQLHQIKLIEPANGAQTKVTFKDDHGLTIGDRLEVIQARPDITGMHVVASVPSPQSIVIDFIPNFPLASSDASGFARSRLGMDTSVDVGIEVLWHSGETNDSTSARSSFFGFDRSLQRWTFLESSNRTNDSVVGQPGDIQVRHVFGEILSVARLGASLDAQGHLVSGTNFSIAGGNIDGTVIGSSHPAGGFFTRIAIADGMTIETRDLVHNLNADMIDSHHASDFVLRDGSLPLTADWNVGPHKIITSGHFVDTTLPPDHIVTVASDGTLVTRPGLTYVEGKLSVERISGFELDGNVNANGHDLVGVNILNSQVDKTNILVPVGYALNVDGGSLNVANGTFNVSGTGTLDISQGNIIFHDGQIAGPVISGGTANVDISGTSAFVQDGVYRRDFDSAHSILKADEKGVPVSLNVPLNTVIGRKDGEIQAIPFTEFTERDMYLANSFLKADVAGEPVPLVVPENTFVGRDVNGNIDALSIARVQEMLQVPKLSPQVMYDNGALLRSGDRDVPGGGTMTGLLFTSFERFSINTGEVRSLDTTVETSYVSALYLGSGGRVARCRLPDGRADGHRKLIVLSALMTKAVVMITGNIVAPETPNCYAFLFNYRAQSAMLQWDTVCNSWFIVGGAGTNAITLDQMMDASFPDNI